MAKYQHLYEQLPDDAPVMLCDQDGVLADFDGYLQRRIAQVYPDIEPLTPMPEPRPFYTTELYPKKYTAAIWGIVNMRGFIRDLPPQQPIEEIAYGWKEVMQAGFRPQVCSAPLLTPSCKQEKLDWLDEHLVPWFGRWVVDTALITRNKHEVPGKVLVDDKPNIDDSDADWRHVVFTQPPNRHLTDRPRINGWHDPNLIDTILDAIRQS